MHKSHVVKATVDDTVRTLIFTGRPLRLFKTPYVAGWEERQEEIKELCSKGKIPHYREERQREKAGKPPLSTIETMQMLMGQCAGAIAEVKPADAIMCDLITGAIDAMRKNTGKIANL